MKVYLVTDGEYSDYHLCGIYSTREKAEEAKQIYVADRDIEEIELDGLPEHIEGLYCYLVSMNKSGKLRSVDWLERSDRMNKDVTLWDHQEVADFFVMGRDSKHAIKIANERRSYLIATNQWPVVHPYLIKNCHYNGLTGEIY